MNTGTARWIFALVLAAGLCGCAAVVSEAVGWRTDGTGQYDDVDPPIRWSSSDGVVWKTPLPSWSNASPVLVGDRIFVTSEPDRLICLRRSDGQVLWERTNSYDDVLSPQQLAEVERAEQRVRQLTKELTPLKKQLSELSKDLKTSPDDAKAKARQEQLRKQVQPLEAELKSLAELRRPATNKTNGYSSSTPVSDGRSVCTVFGTGVVACYDMEATRQWARVVQKPTHTDGHSASPLLVGGKLLVHIRDLFALDVATGRQLWKAPSKCRWGSPVLARVGDVQVVVTANGEIVRVADGAVLAGKVAALEYGSPVVDGQAVYFIQHKGKAVKLPESLASDEIKPEPLWQTMPKKDRYYASPAVHDGLIYAITQKAVLSIIDAATGNVVLQTKLDLGKGTVYASITRAGEYLFISGENGTTVVLEPGREYKEAARNGLEPFRSTPVFAGDRMYVRSLKHMYCIGK